MTHTTPEDRIISRRAVTAKTSLSKTTIWRLGREGGFPKPIKLSANRVGWSQNTVDAWLASRAINLDKAA